MFGICGLDWGAVVVVVHVFVFKKGGREESVRKRGRGNEEGKRKDH